MQLGGDEVPFQPSFPGVWLEEGLERIQDGNAGLRKEGDAESLSGLGSFGRR